MPNTANFEYTQAVELLEVSISVRVYFFECFALDAGETRFCLTAVIVPSNPLLSEGSSYDPKAYVLGDKSTMHIKVTLY